MNQYPYNPNTTSVADVCGRRVIGMGGSLSAYVQTGNPYHNDYYIKSNSPNKKTKKNSWQKAIDVLKIAAIAVASIFTISKGAKVAKKATKAMKTCFHKVKNYVLDKADRF